ncbi:MAG: glycosyltransferase [Kofleriaceae bacterium]|nr:glycosyltransferase [Myxococcales bacterium]MCB9564523.1 glycosyltransferase [Kofleriaceae bacterium]
MTSLLQAVIIPIVLLLTAGRLATWLLRSRREDDPGTDATPTVTVVTPMFNEGASIRRTIRSILAQDYPADRLRLIVVDDCSTDDSYDHAIDEARGDARVRVLRNEINQGKRASINRAVRETDSEIIVSVDSDVELEPDAIRHLLRRFTSPRIAAVGGRVDIRNKRVNWLTRMQAAKYYYDYHVLKTLEREFASVMCLSGCLTAYRRHVLVELSPILETRNILGVPIKYGEDRFLTRQIVKAGYQTTMTMDAVCRTDASEGLSTYFAQQLRWRRSNIVDYIGGLSHVWKIHPVVAVHFYSLFLMVLAYPVLVVYSLFSGHFWPLMVGHLWVVAMLGVGYRVMTRKLPAHQRVSAAAMLPMALVAPVTYAILTPLALLTLDSRAWETRGHQAPADEAAEAPAPAPALQPVLRVRRGGVAEAAEATLTSIHIDSLP